MSFCPAFDHVVHVVWAQHWTTDASAQQLLGQMAEQVKQNQPLPGGPGILVSGVPLLSSAIGEQQQQQQQFNLQHYLQQQQQQQIGVRGPETHLGLPVHALLPMPSPRQQQQQQEHAGVPFLYGGGGLGSLAMLGGAAAQPLSGMGAGVGGGYFGGGLPLPMGPPLPMFAVAREGSGGDGGGGGEAATNEEPAAKKARTSGFASKHPGTSCYRGVSW